MDAVIIIVWFVGLVISIMSVFKLVGLSGLIEMFPEGNRWWILPSQMAAIMVFALMVHIHPF